MIQLVVLIDDILMMDTFFEQIRSEFTEEYFLHGSNVNLSFPN